MDSADDRRLFDEAVSAWNARDPHAAHEFWEEIWHEAEGARRDWLQGLIQYAAALFHVERGFYASGFVKLMRSAKERVAGYDATPECIDAAALTRALSPWHDHAVRVERGAALGDAPPPWPTIAYRDGSEPEMPDAP